MSRKKWCVAQTDRELAKSVAEECGIDPLLALILTARGMTEPYEIDEFLSDDQQLSDPFELKDMDKAAQRLNAAIDAFERIAVYGDYDADGVTSTALVYDYLSSRGADVIYTVPEREDGYGMNINEIKRLKDSRVSLIVTVDNGISAHEEIKYAASLGIDVIVTDHHLPPAELPEAYAVVDPHRADCPSTFKYYAGVGVAFKLICAVEGCSCEEMCERYSDLVTIGTIADIMPLTGENRLLVKHGLGLMPDARPGISALAALAGLSGKPITASGISFGIAPRLNAAGRMGLCERAVRLLTETDAAAALELASEIHEDNTQRQCLEREIVKEAEAYIGQSPAMRYDRVLVIKGNGWKHGIIGIVASRLCEQYGRPTIVISVDDGIAIGSARSIAGFSIFDAISACADLLDRFGGHEQAAGITIDEDKIDAFREKINEYAAEHFDEMPFSPLKIDCKLSPAAFTPNLAHALEPLEPFGSGNPAPVFGLFRMRLDRITPVCGGKHLRLELSRDAVRLSAMLFSVTPEEFGFSAGNIADFAVTVGASEYNGREQLTISVKGIRPFGVEEDELLSDIRLYERVCRGEKLSEEQIQRVAVTREDIAKIFRVIKSENGFCGTVEALFYHGLVALTYIKVRLALDILAELSILQVSCDGDVLKVQLCPVADKMNLEQSALFRKINDEVGKGE